MPFEKVVEEVAVGVEMAELELVDEGITIAIRKNNVNHEMIPIYWARPLFRRCMNGVTNDA